ncbi:hypothetical protein CRUP_006982 [Coryphaenoides rupestris]|nr:hypothetical protein CRUP_006982 [Coryphaenoides rupestris]
MDKAFISMNGILNGSIPDILKPPKGTSTGTPAARPKVLSLALLSTSSSESKESTDMTGPKISSFTQVMSSLQSPRSHSGVFVERVSDLDGLGPPDHLPQELGQDALVNEHPDTQSLTCPWERKLAMSAPFTAFSMSLSSNTSRGDFPPSSRVTGFTPLDAISIICCRARTG